jgi:hypothetical protein
MLMIRRVANWAPAWLLVLVLIVGIFTLAPSAFAAGKVTGSPATVQEGQSQVVEIRLTQPIICPVLPDGEVCEVNLSLTSSDPSMLSISPGSVNYTHTQWAEVRSVIVEATHDGIYTPDQAITVSITASGNAPYYTNSVSTFTVTIANIDSAELTGSSSYTGTRDDDIAIDDLQVQGVGSDQVALNLLVSSGTLSMSNIEGLNFTEQQTGRNLHFSGTRTDLNVALATLTFTTSETANATLQVVVDGLENSVYDAAKHHIYEVDTPGFYPTWSEANTAAQGKIFSGATGYLATITSSDEQNFVSRLTSEGWIGGSDIDQEGEWKWVGGDEAGLSFWQGDADTGAPVDNAYSNWVGGMPDNYSGSNAEGEDCLQMYNPDYGGELWNDQNCDAQQSPNYITEYGDDNHPVLLSSKDISINVTTGHDFNDDDIEDADQPNVATYINILTDKRVVMDVGTDCEVTTDDLTSEINLPVQDEGYDYPNGLFDFEAECDFPGINTTIKLFYYDVSIDNVVLRKFNPNTQTYADVPGVTLEQVNINGHSVAVATYQVIDGGELDTDGLENGEISDPAGLATVFTPAAAVALRPASTSTTLAGTGLDSTSPALVGALLLVTSLFSLLLSCSKSRSNSPS